MSIIVGFTIILMFMLFGYMAYRLFLRRKLLILLSFCMQIFALTIAIVSFLSDVNILTSNIVELIYIVFGVAIPTSFFIYDYSRMMKKIKGQGVYEGFVQAIPKDLETEYSINLNKKYVNPILKERQVSELVKDLNINKDDILKNLKKSLTQAQLYINNRDYENAYDIYNTLVKLIKNCPSLYFNYANICYFKENYTEAVQSYKKVLEINEKRIKGHEDYQYSVTSENVKNGDNSDISKTEAEIRYEECVVYYNMGNAQFQLNKFEQAIDSYKKALAINPRLEETNENIARALIAMEKVDEALEYYMKIVEGDRTNYKVHYIIGKLYSEIKKYEQCIEELKECIKLNHSCKEAYETLGQVLAKLGKHTESIEAFKKLIKIDNEDFRAHYSIGTSYYHINEKEKAVEAFKKVIEIKPDNYKSYFNMAVAFEEMEKQDEAIQAFKKVIEIKTDFIDAYNNLGILLSTLGRHLEALDIYIKGLKKNPEEYSLYYNMGITLSEMGRYSEAVEAYKNALEIKPDEHEISYHLGAALTELKKYSEAVDIYKSAIKFKPTDSELFYNLSIVYSLLKKHEIAIDNLKKAIELNSELKEDAKFNRSFDGLKNKNEFKEIVS